MDIKTRLSTSTQNVKALRSRANAMLARLDELEGKLEGAINTLEQNANEMTEAVSLEELGAELRSLIQEWVAAKLDEVNVLSGQVEELPERVKATVDNEHVITVGKAVQELDNNVSEAAQTLREHLESTIRVDVLEKSVEQLSTSTGNLTASMQVSATALHDRLVALVQHLEQEMQDIGNQQESWIEQRRQRWSERANDLSSVIDDDISRLITRRDEMLQRYNVLAHDALETFEGLSNLRATVGDATDSSQTGINVVTDLLEEVRELLNTVS